VSAGNKLFRRYTAVVAALFIVGTVIPSTDGTMANANTEYVDSGIEQDASIFLTDSDGYLAKSNPQTMGGDRTTMNDKLVHVVQSGETVSTIANSYGLKTRTLLWENGLASADSIRIGQKLFIPPVDGVTHYAKKTDTVDKLAKAYGVSTDSIKRQNNLVASNLALGQAVFIPGGKPLVEETIIVRNTPVRVGTSSRVDYVGTSTGGAILPDSNAVPAGSKPFIFPTRGKVTQTFHPGHYAYDIADSSRPPIWAAGEGTVIKAVTGCADVSHGCGGGYGNHIIIDHGNGLQTLYGHLEYLNVKVGDHVSRGQVLGKMGRSGNVRGRTGIHLHFEVRLNGKKMVPGNYY